MGMLAAMIVPADQLLLEFWIVRNQSLLVLLSGFPGVVVINRQVQGDINEADLSYSYDP
jgi:hypothetical protein